MITQKILLKDNNLKNKKLKKNKKFNGGAGNNIRFIVEWGLWPQEKNLNNIIETDPYLKQELESLGHESIENLKSKLIQ